MPRLNGRGEGRFRFGAGLATLVTFALSLAGRMFLHQMGSMNFDDQIHRYFGTTDLTQVSADGLEAGIERMKVDLGLTNDRGERFALWSLLYTLGSAPDLDAVFENDAEREAARNFMDLMQGAGD